MAEDFVAVVLGGNYYGLPKYGHRKCAYNASQGHYVTQPQVEETRGPLRNVICCVCQQSLVSSSPDDQTNTRTPR